MGQDDDRIEVSGHQTKWTSSTVPHIQTADTSKTQPRDGPQRRKHTLLEHGYVADATFSPSSSTTNIYLGSYGKGRSARKSQPGSKNSSRRNSAHPSPHLSASHLHLEHLLGAVDVETETYDVDELRDGFFDASFFRPVEFDHHCMVEKAKRSLPVSFQRLESVSMGRSLLNQWHSFIAINREIIPSQNGIRLLKSFLGFFVAYVLCLIPPVREWLGKYNYVIVVSAIINHPGRTIGSQLDGAVLTTAGTALGLGWGSLAVYVSTATSSTRAGYGGVIATFLLLFTANLGWLRCVYIRLYQAIVCAGIAICYVCLANTSEALSWTKIRAYSIPWALGQALSLLVCFVIFPTAGTSPLALSFHKALDTIRAGLTLPRPESISLKRQLARQFVDLPQAVRDFTIDLSVSRYNPDDVRSLRNLLQGVLRGTSAIRPQTTLFNHLGGSSEIDFDPLKFDDMPMVDKDSSTDPVRLLCKVLSTPTRRLLDTLQDSISHTDEALIDISGHRRFLSSRSNIPPHLNQIIDELRLHIAEFDAVDEYLVNHPSLPLDYADNPEMEELLLFIHPLRQVADKVSDLLHKVLEMQGKKLQYKIYRPSYPFHKSLLRSNAQVRHDRGSITAGYYFHSKDQLQKAMSDLQSRTYDSYRGQDASDQMPVAAEMRCSSSSKSKDEDKTSLKEHERATKQARLRYHAWEILHRLQRFESRYAFKITLITTLLSIPAWLPSSRDWWNDNECWWTIATIWIMMHPRVGGNLQDLLVRTSCAVLGCLFGGIAYGAGNGNPFVVAVFAVLFMIPMLYRFTQSSHPRSGSIGCVTFTVVSLDAYTCKGLPSTVDITWTRGITFVVGVVAAIVINWVLWPFVARHELRKSLSIMMLHSAVLYRSVVAKYIYSNEVHKPSSEEIEKSEILEGRLREGFVRIRQLMGLTYHEIRVRAPFDPLPYSGLIQACENLFEHLVQVRQSSLYFQPHMLDNSSEATDALFTVRRDAVATILMNLYVLAGALRSGNPVPRYLPSAAASRRRLLDKMEEVEEKRAKGRYAAKVQKGKERRWVDVYHYAYSEALTDIVENLQELQYFTTEVVGEVGFDIGKGV